MFAKQMFAQLRTALVSIASSWEMFSCCLGYSYYSQHLKSLGLAGGLGFSQFSGLGLLTGVMNAAQRTVIV